MCLSLKPTIIFRNQEMPPPMGPGIVTSQVITPATPARKGSLRPKIWDLSTNAHCPVIGVCLPLLRLQSLMTKAGHQVSGMTHYQQHLVAVAECRRHSRLAEIVQRDLDLQFQQVLQVFKNVRETDELRQRWLQAKSASHWAGVFWALLTHARVTPALSDEVLGDVHMLQHQVGMASRLDQQQALRVQHQQTLLQAQLRDAQQRAQNQQQEGQKRLQALESSLAEQKALVLQSQTEAHRAQARLRQWQDQNGDMVLCAQLQSDNAHLRDTIALLEKSLRRAHPCASVAENTLAVPLSVRVPAEVPTAWQWLQSPDHPLDKSQRVVCVGGAAAHVPLYRQAVESSGGRFSHHDGGIEHKLSRLEQCLARADLVICQTGCISHNAYWRVKEHCKRTGKPCAFVGNPSPQAMRQLMQELTQAQGFCAGVSGELGI